jgi:putative transposase
VKFNFIEVEKASFPVIRLCKNLGVSRSGFYRWVEEGESSRVKKDADLSATIVLIHERSRGTYGSPRVFRELRESHGVRVGKKRVERLMRVIGIVGRRKRRFQQTTDSKHEHAVSANLLGRNFTASAPNKTWVADVKAIRVTTGWLYLAAILDLYSRRLVGWAMSDSNDTDLALAALWMAARSRSVKKGLLHHSDQGSPYASHRYREELKTQGMEQSMSRKGDCWDNAVAESFFSTLEWEHLDRRPVKSEKETRAEVEGYLDFYNHERRHSTVGLLSPVEFELRCFAAVGAA